MRFILAAILCLTLALASASEQPNKNDKTIVKYGERYVYKWSMFYSGPAVEASKDDVDAYLSPKKEEQVNAEVVDINTGKVCGPNG